MFNTCNGLQKYKCSNLNTQRSRNFLVRDNCARRQQWPLITVHMTTVPVTIVDGWMLRFNMSMMMTVGMGHSRRYCKTGYDQSQGRKPSTLKCIGSISKGDIEPQPSRQKLVRIRTADREVMVAPGGTAIPGRQSRGQRPRSLPNPIANMSTRMFLTAKFPCSHVVVSIPPSLRLPSETVPTPDVLSVS